MTSGFQISNYNFGRKMIWWKQKPNFFHILTERKFGFWLNDERPNL